jgi:hypothetical protein
MKGVVVLIGVKLYKPRMVRQHQKCIHRHGVLRKICKPGFGNAEHISEIVYSKIDISFVAWTHSHLFSNPLLISQTVSLLNTLYELAL